MQIRVLDSALKHGLTEEDILWALENSQMHNTVRRSGNINKEVDLVLGTLKNGNLCEIMSTVSYDETEVVVFHAIIPNNCKTRADGIPNGVNYASGFLRSPIVCNPNIYSQITACGYGILSEYYQSALNLSQAKSSCGVIPCFCF